MAKKRRLLRVLSLVWALHPCWAAAETEGAVRGSPALRASANRAGVGFDVHGDSLRLVSCGATCASGATSETLLPPEVRGVAPVAMVVALPGGHSILQLRFGKADERAFHVLIRGAARGQEVSQPPAVLLRGFAGGAAGFQIAVHREQDQTHLVVSRQAEGFCGRALATDVRRFDPERNEFVAARLPPFDNTERSAALPLAAVPLVQSEGLLPARPIASAISTDKAKLWLDGDVATVASDPWDVLVMELPAATRALVMNAGPASQPRSVWLWADQKLLRIAVPQQAGSYEVPLQLKATACVALIGDAKPANLSEVRAHVELNRAVTTESLVSALNDPAQAGAAALALLDRGEPAAHALAKGFTQLTPEARRVALRVAPSFGRPSQIRIELAALMTPLSATEREELEVRFTTHGEAALPPLSEALEQAQPAREVELLTLLSKISGPAAVALGSKRLDKASPAQRRALRRFLAGLGGQPQLVVSFKEQLSNPALARRSRIELLRALTPGPSAYQTAATETAGYLLQTKSFKEQYLLLEPVTFLAVGNSELGELLQARARTIEPTWSTVQAEAWMAQLLELLTERAAEAKVGGAFEALAGEQLGSSNMRVRRAAARYLGESGGAPATLLLVPVMLSDGWPAVREESVRALGRLAQRGKKGSRQSEAILRVLEQDESALVRRSAARALRFMPGVESLQMLRHVLDEDADMKVRAEAATSLGRVCDVISADRLTELALQLKQPMDEATVELSLAALSSLAELNPPDLNKRLQPLRGAELPGQLRGQIDRVVERAKQRSNCGPTPKSARK